MNNPLLKGSYSRITPITCFCQLCRSWLAAPRSFIPCALPGYTIGFTVFHLIAAKYFLVSALSAVGKCVALGIVIAEG